MRGKRRQLLALNEIQIVNASAGYPPLNPIPTNTFTINGEVMPVLIMRPGGQWYCIKGGGGGKVCD